MQKANDSFNNVAIDFVKGNDYRIFWYMSKDEAINGIKSPDLKEKNKYLKRREFFFVIIKMSDKNIYEW